MFKSLSSDSRATNALDFDFLSKVVIKKISTDEYKLEIKTYLSQSIL